MAAQQSHTVWAAYLSSTADLVAIGDCMIPSDTARHYVVATTANRAAAVRTSRVAGISLSTGTSQSRAIEIQTVGPCPPSITGLAAGTASDLRVSATGRLERCTLAEGDIYAGKCDADGFAYLDFSSRAPSSGGGTVATAIDIARSDGTTIDTVQAIRGNVVTAGTLAVGETYAKNSVSGTLKARAPVAGNFDCVDFDILANGSDMSSRVREMFAAAGPGATFRFGNGVYVLSSDVIVQNNSHIKGCGNTGGTGGTEFRFAAGAQLIFPHFATGQAFAGIATANHSTVEKIGFQKYTKSTITPWAASTAVTVGTQRIIVALSNEMDDYRHVFIECIRAGTTGVLHPTPTEPDMFSVPFTVSTVLHFGQLIRGATTAAAIDATGSNLVTNRLFRVTTAGTTGASFPTFNTTLGGTTTSGSVTFTAVDSAAFWTTDGTVVWRHRNDTCITATTRMHFNDLWVEGSGGPGIYIRGNASGTVVTNANGWTAKNIRSRHCGVGFMTQGSDSGAGVAFMIDVEGAGAGQPGNGGHGIYDSSGVGNTWIQCQIANNPEDGGGHSYLTNAGASRAYFLGCYAEGWSAASRNKHIMVHLPGANVRWDGGTLSCGYSDEFEPARDGSYTRAAMNLDSQQGASRDQTLQTRIGNTIDSTAAGAVGSIVSHGASSNITEMTGLSGLVSGDANKYVTVTGAANTSNNGTFRITEVVGSTSLFCINTKDAATGTDTNNGAISWYTGGGVVTTYLGARDLNGHVIGWAGPGYTGSNKMGLGYSAVLSAGFLGSDWWCFSYQGDGAKVMAAMAGPNAKMFNGTAITDHPFYIPGRLMRGPKTANGVFHDVGAVAPTLLYSTVGSLRWSTVPSSSSPLLWTCSATGTPGTWKPITAVLDEDVEPKVATLTTTATTANQVIGTAPGIVAAAAGLKNLYRVYAEVSGGGAAGAAIAGTVDGTFRISDAGVVTREGSDVTVAARGTLTPTFSLVISGSTVGVCVTPSSAVSTAWKATIQVTKLSGITA